MTLPKLSPKALATLVVVAIVAVFAIVKFTGAGQIHVTAYFSQFKGIYVGDDVDVLGVPVGKVTSVQPGPNNVKVEFEISADHPVPADVRAAVVAPSLVSVRSIVLGPVGATSGPMLQDNAVIPESRTTVPVEWDDIKTELTQLTSALGPNGANKKGATSQLLNSTAAFLQGNGASLHQTIEDVSKAMSTLSDNSGNLFATVNNLQVFIAAIKGSDAQVRLFETRLASVTQILDADRGSLSGALNSMRSAFSSVGTFLKQNRSLTVDTMSQLRSTSSLLAADRQHIADILQVVPTALSNFYNILDPRIGGGPTGELAVNNLNSPAQIICGAILAVGGDRTACQQALAPLVKYLAIEAPPIGIGGVSSNAAGGGGVIPQGSTSKGSSSNGGTGRPSNLITQLLGGL